VSENTVNRRLLERELQAGATLTAERRRPGEPRIVVHRGTEIL